MGLEPESKKPTLCFRAKLRIDSYASSATDEENAANAKAVNKNNWKETSGAQKKLRLSYKEQREWETIEGDIAGLEEAIAALETEIEKSASNYTRLNELMTEKEAQLEEKMDRWMYLTDLVEQIESQK